MRPKKKKRRQGLSVDTASLRFLVAHAAQKPLYVGQCGARTAPYILSGMLKGVPLITASKGDDVTICTTEPWIGGRQTLCADESLQTIYNLCAFGGNLHVSVPRRLLGDRWSQQAPLPVNAVVSLDLRSEAKILAKKSGDNFRRVRIAAYTGEPLTSQGAYGWEHPIVIDLDGVKVPGGGRVPILDGHAIDRRAVIGQTDTVRVTGSQLIAVGKLFPGSSKAAAHACRLADDGYVWQASVGANCKAREFIEEGNSINVNGRSYEGPLYVSAKTIIREISLVPVGDDMNTIVDVE